MKRSWLSFLIVCLLCCNSKAGLAASVSSLQDQELVAVQPVVDEIGKVGAEECHELTDAEIAEFDFEHELLLLDEIEAHAPQTQHSDWELLKALVVSYNEHFAKELYGRHYGALTNLEKAAIAPRSFASIAHMIYTFTNDQLQYTWGTFKEQELRVKRDTKLTCMQRAQVAYAIAKYALDAAADKVVDAGVCAWDTFLANLTGLKRVVLG